MKNQITYVYIIKKIMGHLSINREQSHSVQVRLGGLQLQLRLPQRAVDKYHPSILIQYQTYTIYKARALIWPSRSCDSAIGCCEETTARPSWIVLDGRIGLAIPSRAQLLWAESWVAWIQINLQTQLCFSEQVTSFFQTYGSESTICLNWAEFGWFAKLLKLPKKTTFQDLRAFAGICGSFADICGSFAGNFGSANLQLKPTCGHYTTN